MSFIHQHKANIRQPCASPALKNEGRLLSTFGGKMDNGRLKTQGDSEK